MAQVLPIARINKSVEHLQALQKQLQDQLTTRQQWIATRVDETKAQLERRQQVLIGQTKDQQLLRLYELQQRAYDMISQILERLESVSPLGKAALQARHDHLVALLGEIEARKQALQSPSIEDYDGLNVKQVNSELESLDYYQLQKLRTYEQAHKNRVTILREVDRLLD